MDENNPAPAGSQIPAQSQPKEPIEVNLAQDWGGSPPASLSSLSDRLTEPFRKEMTARRIGTMLIIIFGISVAFLIWEGFRVVFYSMDKPEHTRVLINEAVIPLLEKIATFLTTVFSPLLAFILGYYFGQKQTDANKG
jgi:hypothetical protein